VSSSAWATKIQGRPIPDADGDGINDEVDGCKTIAGVKKYNGCPDLEPNNDGIIDDMDSSRNVGGKGVGNGCPITVDETETLQKALLRGYSLIRPVLSYYPNLSSPGFSCSHIAD
jgi:hypothetical protein